MAMHCMVDEFEYEGLLLPGAVTSPSLLDKVRKVRLMPEDVVVATYCKSGTTWTKYLLYLMKNNGVDKGDPDTNLTVKDVRYLEFLWPGDKEEEHLQMDRGHRSSPAVFTTHLPYRLLQPQVLEDKVKVVAVIRNPKDVLVSLFFHYQMHDLLGSFSGSWDEFFELMKKKPYYEDVLDYILGWWKVRDLDNVLIIRYEEMKADLESVVRKLARFSGQKLSDEVTQNIVEQGSFDKMKDNPRVNFAKDAQEGQMNFAKSKFMRKGVVGDWVNYFSEEQSKYIEARCEEKCTPLGLNFQWH